MTDIPILCTPAMVRALLDGRQTQDRRLAWSQPKRVGGVECKHGWDNCPECDARKPSSWQKVQPGDRLWVREPIRILTMNVDGQRGPKSTDILYAADDDETGTWHTIDWRQRADLQDAEVPATHMPRVASRLTLTVTDVRMQHLQDITEAEAWAQGCKRGLPDDVGGFFPAEEPCPDGGFLGWDSARDWFADLWDATYGEDAFEANPEVVALTFTVAQHNIDKEQGRG